jgi:hypothetical protein
MSSTEVRPGGTALVLNACCKCGIRVTGPCCWVTSCCPRELSLTAVHPGCVCCVFVLAAASLALCSCVSVPGCLCPHTLHVPLVTTTQPRATAAASIRAGKTRTTTSSQPPLLLQLAVPTSSNKNCNSCQDSNQQRLWQPAVTAAGWCNICQCSGVMVAACYTQLQCMRPFCSSKLGSWFAWLLCHAALQRLA